MKKSNKNSGNFILSLPERLVRVISAGSGGLFYQLSLILFPERIRRSRLYQATIERLLRIIVELLGGVRGAFPAEAMSVRELATRKAAGNVVELASFIAVGWSPVWLLAAAADVLGGSQVYLQALVHDLKCEGVLDPQTEVDSIEVFLSEMEKTMGQAADIVDLPPLNIDDMRYSWTKLKERGTNLPDLDSLARIYGDLKAVAQQEEQSIYRTSSLIAQGAVRTGIEMGNLHIFEYYRNALDAIASEGISHYIQRVSRPYQQAVSEHINPDSQTFTERFINRRRQERQPKKKEYK